MKFKKLKKICLGLLSSAGVLSSSGITKAAETAVVNNVVTNVKNETAANNLKSDEETEKTTEREILPIDYIPKEKVEVFDLYCNNGEEKGFETENLTIEPLNDDSLSKLMKLYDESVYEWMTTESREGVKLNTRIKLSSINPTNPNGGNTYSLVVHQKTTKEPIGLITATVYRGGIAKYSYWLGKDFRGKGYAFEAMKEFNRRMFANEEIKTVGVRAYDDNKASLKLTRKFFDDLHQLYPNNVLIEHTKKENGRNISHHYLSKFTFDPAMETSFVSGNVKLDKVRYEDYMYMLKYLLSEENAKNLPEKMKEALKIKLDNLQSGKLSLDNSSSIYIVSEFDQVTGKMVKPNGFVSMTTIKDGENKGIFELSYVNDQGVEGVNELSSKSYFALAKKLLCGTKEQKLKIKLPGSSNEVSKELTELLEKDPSNKILKIRVEKDAAGSETSLYIEKKNSNKDDANFASIKTDAAGQKLNVEEKSAISENTASNRKMDNVNADSGKNMELREKNNPTDPTEVQVKE